jgi:hypothetical protein
MPRFLSLALLGLAFVAAGCDVFGSKDDATTDDIFRQGRIDPNAVSEIGYVPVQPFFTQGVGGAFQAPMDVYVGFDQFVYVVDTRGVHVLDRAGRPQFLMDRALGQAFHDVQSVIQDRRFHVYVTARRDTTVENRTRRLPVVYRISGLTTGAPRVEDVIWHPFDDLSRQIILRQPQDFDEQTRFTSVAVQADNRIYVARSGPGIQGLTVPLNTVMAFSPSGTNERNLTQLSASRPSLLSSVNPTAVLTRVHPPQRSSFSSSLDFWVAQSPVSTTGVTTPINFGVLSIRVTETPDGLLYNADTAPLVAAQRGRALYTTDRFARPTGLAYAADGTNYLFVVDAGKDSVFVFNSAGVEGVAPPPGARDPQPVRVSFGGSGDGPLRLRNPQGIAYHGRIVYVADTGNNRIARYRLNTDFE